MVDRKIIVFSLNADDGGQSPRGRFRIFHYEFISPTPFFALCSVSCLHKQCWSPPRLQGRALSPRAGSQGSYLCAGTNFRNGCLFGTSMLINGRLGRQLSLVLSGIAKGRGAGLFVSDQATFGPMELGPRLSVSASCPTFQSIQSCVSAPARRLFCAAPPKRLSSFEGWH
jgi:hypothetical protein